jgi:ribosomal protein S18 acetylase RimI-like enzyme
LGVWEKNKKAIEFYTKLGFQIKGEKTFLLGNDKQRDLIMQIFV